ncbi:hypothetical protein PhaeoP66_03244 [Phaeobacter inhibens]|uniref:Uncharacterized protein n=1 Tax=Phaeobacter inhibens TaxID=221822 RepID=A0ABN5GTK5_9RHOB|nr:hypothetical protein [Phaeobacter inhibens]AUQ95986.1 hypothetical protein PhaeoP66_03244 [Phaeobacter inhibens]
MSRQVTLAGQITRTTDSAVFWEDEEEQQTAWIPRSVLLDGETLDVGDADIVCAEWFAEKEGLL